MCAGQCDQEARIEALEAAAKDLMMHIGQVFERMQDAGIEVLIDFSPEAADLHEQAISEWASREVSRLGLRRRSEALAGLVPGPYGGHVG